MLKAAPDIGLKASRPIVDVLSIDAEGAEVEILKDFPFQAWDIRAVVVETSRRTAMAIDGLLLPRGFLKVAVLGKDAVYVHRIMAAALPPTGPVLPERIQWSEPGSGEDTIDYMRFQRLFGTDGDLDHDVGDPRLQNETELARQFDRTETQQAALKARLLDAARGAAVGGALSDSERAALDTPGVQEALQITKVKEALVLLAQDEAAFLQQLSTSALLREKIGDLIRAGVVRHVGASALLGVPVGDRGLL